MRNCTWIWLCLVTCLFAFTPVSGQGEPPAPPSAFRKFLSDFSGNFAFSMPLKKKDPQQRTGLSSQGEEALVPTLQMTLHCVPRSNWFFATTFYAYFPGKHQAPWDPDFAYRFGYEDWRPFTFSLTYANYGGNRLWPDRSSGEKFSRFSEGTLDLGWKFVLPENLHRPIKIHETSSLDMRVDYYLAPRYEDQASNTWKSAKHAFGFTARYAIYKWWFVMASARYYPNANQQQPWDPDIIYEFGYSDWHPGTLSLRYSNYSGTRYPWRTQNPDTGSFRNGTIALAWSWAF